MIYSCGCKFERVNSIAPNGLKASDESKVVDQWRAWKDGEPYHDNESIYETDQGLSAASRAHRKEEHPLGRWRILDENFTLPKQDVPRKPQNRTDELVNHQ